MDARNFVRNLTPEGFDSAHQPELLRLPHPRRMELAGFLAMFDHFLERRGVTVSNYFGDPSHSLARIATRFSLLIGLEPESIAEGPGTQGLGGLHTYCAAMRYRHHDGRTITLPDPLYRELSEALPLRDLPLSVVLDTPQPSLFVEFGTARELGGRLYNQLSAWHVIEGCYVFVSDMPGDAFGEGNPLLETLHIDTRQSMRVIDYLICGSPHGKHHYLDDTTHLFTIFLQSHLMDEPLLSALRRHQNVYESYTNGIPGWRSFTPEEKQSIVDAIQISHAGLQRVSAGHS
jgi:hypothetical protein